MYLRTVLNRIFHLRSIRAGITILLAVVLSCLVFAGSAHADMLQQTPTPSVTEIPTSAATTVATVVQTSATQLPVENLVVHVLVTYPHETDAYTEGLERHGSTLLESTGLNGASTLREVDLQTGHELRRAILDKNLYGEGISVSGDKIVQLTWLSGVALVYDLATFKQIGTFNYDGEGWGLCFDGQQFYMSNGSANITVRDAKTFAVVSIIPVTLHGEPVPKLNELECLPDVVYANVWHTDNIVRIDKTTGQVTAQINASGLLTAQETALTGPEGVLNGIAYDPDTKNFLITGKFWPWMFRVEFVKSAPIAQG